MIQFLATTLAGFCRLFQSYLLHRTATLTLVAVVCLLMQSLFFPVVKAESATPPNIVFILADDLGYGDLGCYGHPIIKTPHIDRLAKEGVRFTQHYSNGPECSPTRTAFLTGRYQQRIGGLECAIGTGNVGRYDDAIRLAAKHELGLPADESVLPKVLVEKGYRCGIFGKWHLGYEEQFNPMHFGWHEFKGYLGGNVHYFNHRELSDIHVLYQGTKPVTRDGYMTHLITDDTIQFIRRNSANPFFAYVAHECPHFPYQGPNDHQKVVTEETWMDLDQDAYVSMIEDLDNEVGKILSTLKASGLEQNTLVIFASDNGGFAGAANMGPLSGSKGTTMEGGIRVPMIMRWPGQIAAGQVSHQTCLTFDLTRSFAKLAGADATQHSLEGYDIVSHVVEQKPDFDRTLFWRGRRGNKTWAAVRDGDLKYVRKQIGDSTDHFLFNLAKDIGEQTSMAASSPVELQRMQRLLKAWESDVKPVR